MPSSCAASRDQSVSFCVLRDVWCLLWVWMLLTFLLHSRRGFFLPFTFSTSLPKFGELHFTSASAYSTSLCGKINQLTGFERVMMQGEAMFGCGNKEPFSSSVSGNRVPEPSSFPAGVSIPPAVGCYQYMGHSAPGCREKINSLKIFLFYLFWSKFYFVKLDSVLLIHLGFSPDSSPVVHLGHKSLIHLLPS